MRLWRGLPGGLVLLLAAGCQAPGERGDGIDRAAADPLDQRSAAVRAAPREYLESVLNTCSQAEQYTLTLVRQERRGILSQLTPPERIAAWFRREPFSVRFLWLDESVKYGESTFVSGLNRDRVRFAPRHGIFGGPPPILNVSLQTPVTWGEARYPVTEFGIEKMMRRTLRSIDETRGEAQIEYVGLVRPESAGGTRADATGGDAAAGGLAADANDGATTNSASGDVSATVWPARPLHRFLIRYPSWYSETTLQELLIDAQTDLPWSTTLRLPDGSLDSRYEFRDLDPHVRLTDADFVLEADRERAATTAGR